MNDSPRTAAQAAQRVGSGAGRVSRAWRKLPPERRLAAGAALGLLVTLFLPWYQDTVILSGASKTGHLSLASASITGWGAFSFVEAAVLLVAAAVLILLFVRAEGGAFHVPGGDGGVIMAAGVWTCGLIIWRIFDQQSNQSNHGLYLTSTGIEWGILVALGVAVLLAYAGSRIRLANVPEPPLPGEGAVPRRGARAAAAAAGTASRRPGIGSSGSEGQSQSRSEAGSEWDDAPTWSVPSAGGPPRPIPAADGSSRPDQAAGSPPPRPVPGPRASSPRFPAAGDSPGPASADQAPTRQLSSDEASTRQVSSHDPSTRAVPPHDAPPRLVSSADQPTRPETPRPDDGAGTRPDARRRGRLSGQPELFPDIEGIDFSAPELPRRRSSSSADPDGSPSDNGMTTPIDPRPD